MKGEHDMVINNAVIHNFPSSDYVAKSSLNLRYNKQILLRLCLRDEESIRKYLNKHFPTIPVKTINHN